MSKPEPALLDPARYPFRCEIEPRYSDLDSNMHINNAALAGILQEARSRYHRASGYDVALKGITSMAASLSIQYLGQGHYPETLEIHVAATTVGRTSHTVGQLVMQEGRLIAYAQTVLVCVKNDKPTENPAEFRESIKPWMLRQ